MPPFRGEARSSGKSSKSPARTKAQATNLEAGRRLSSLSSFQPTLRFAAAPHPSPTMLASSGPPSSTSRNQDANAMPPPPTGFKTKTKAFGSSNGIVHSAANGREPAVNGKGKGKARAEVIELLGDEDDKPLRGTTDQMWSDVYAPISEADLAPGKARVAKVKAWLHEAMLGVPMDCIPAVGGAPQGARDKVRRYKRILLLTGAAGVGKTTTVKVLAKEMGVELVEWAESVDARSLGVGGADRESSLSKISAFLSRSSYTPLNLSGKPSSPSPSSSSRSQQQKETSRPRILLLTSLPNISHLPTRDAFHAILLDFCKSYTPSSCPLIIIHSDAGSGGRAEESWIDRERGGREGTLEVLGKEVKEGPWCQEIDFLPLAPTFLSKAIKRILTLALPPREVPPSPSALQLIALSSNGDLRSAINSLQMLCRRRLPKTEGTKRKAEEDDSGSRKKPSGRGSKGGKGSRVDVSEDVRAVLDAITRREQSLGLFHALGKILYNKRLGDPGEEDEDQEVLAVIKALPPDDILPRHLKSFERRKSLVQMEAVAPAIPLDASSFALWLHESLPSFCAEIEQASEGFDRLCDADIMRTDDDMWQSSIQAISYALHLTIRGTQMSLPTPVHRNHQKIVKPEFFERFRTERENAGRVDAAGLYLVKKGIASSIALSEIDLNRPDDEHAPWSGMMSRTVLAGEIISMMTKLQGMTKRPLLPPSVAPLRLPPYFSTTNQPAEELQASEKEMVEGTFEEEAAGEDGLGAMPASGSGWDHEEPADREEEKEYLEEDDIADWD